MKRPETNGWSKSDSVAVAVFASESVLKHFRRRFWKDKNPKKAVQAAKMWLKKGSLDDADALGMAADSAYESARSCAGAAHCAAQCAAQAARCAAAPTEEAAALFAKVAVQSAEKAAHWKGGQKAREKLSLKIERYIQDKVQIPAALRRHSRG